MVGALDPVNSCGPPNLSEPRDELYRGHKYTRRMAKLFWDRWIQEYVPQLQKSQKWLRPKRNFRVADLILICDEPTMGYLTYPYAVITHVKSQLTRTVKYEQ